MRKIITTLIIICLIPMALSAQTRGKTFGVTTLIENRKINDVEGVVTENGLSLYIERHGQTILFDTGSSDNFIRNAGKLGVNLKNVDIVVISHGHMDHVGGLPYFLELNDKAIVYMSKKAQNSPELKNMLSRMEKEYSNRIQSIDEFTPLEIMTRCSAAGLHFRIIPGSAPEGAPPRRAGFIPFRDKSLTGFNAPLGFESQRLEFLTGFTEIGEGTYILTEIKCNELNEIVLILKDRFGVVLFTGCSHSGILNIIEAVRGKFPNVFIKAVFGGFHLSGLSSKEVERIGKRMNNYPIIKIYTGHCTGIKAYLILKSVLGAKVEYLATGSRIYPF